MEPETSLTCSQEPTTGPYPKPAEAGFWVKDCAMPRSYISGVITHVLHAYMC
jgi:hypothetical protein